MRHVDQDNAETRRPPSPEILAIPERVALALKAMKAQGVTAHQVAKACGIPDSRFSKLKHGHHVGGIQADMVLRLARALQVDPGWLLSGDGEMVRGRSTEHAGARLPGIPAPTGPGSPVFVVVQASPGVTPEAILQAVAQVPGATERSATHDQRRAPDPRPATQKGRRQIHT